MAEPLREPLDKESWQKIERVLAETSRTMIQHFLMYHRLPAGTHDNKQEIIGRVHAYLQSGRLDVSYMLGALPQFPEYENKNVYLYRIPRSQLASLNNIGLVSEIPSLSLAEIANAEEPTINYSYRDASSIRVSFTETQEKPQFDIEAYEMLFVPYRRVIVLHVDLRNGLVTLSYDPRVGHNRGRRDKQYYDFYRIWAEEILGLELTSRNLIKAMDRVEDSDYILLPSGTFHLGDGRVDLSSYDYRRMTVYPAVKKATVTKNSGRYIWLSREHLAEAVQSELQEDEGLLREIRTEVFAEPGMVRFTADVLKYEVEYVLDRLL